MLLALALYASIAHANMPHCDLDLLYRDGRAHRVGGGGYDVLLTDFLPRLQSSGISTETIRVITADNPRRALTGSK
jgi:predicted metal-dependent phosphotriesterase family hydrolase